MEGDEMVSEVLEEEGGSVPVTAAAGLTLPVVCRVETPHGEMVVEDARHLIPHENREYERRRKLSGIREIVVHYDAERRPAKYDLIARLQRQARYHISGRNWGVPGGKWIPGFSLMYHLCIGGDGRVVQTQDFELVTWHVKDGNYRAVGVKLCCGEGQEGTEQQLVSLRRVLWWLSYRRPEFPAARKNVWGHGECGHKGPGPNWRNSTKCPGKILPWVVKFREGEW
jgi:hypothetical protein